MSAAPATRAALLTPAGRGAVATIAVWGPHAATAVDRWLQGRLGAAERARPGDLLVARWGAPPSEELVVCRPPMENRCASDCFELHCHGGVAAVERILCDLKASGVERADARAWWDWQPSPGWRRLAGEMLSHARTERTAAILLDQFHGALDQALAAILAQLKSRDRGALPALARLAELAPLGARLVEPWRIALVGQPNAGKSSLLNALAGYQRAIVTATPGTTRDVVQLQTAIDGWPVVLSDTAGVRAATDTIEREGVARAIASADQADLVLQLVDATRGWTSADQALLERWPGALVVYSKCDLAGPPPRPPGLATSATTGLGIAELLAAVSQRLVPQTPEAGEVVPFTSRLGNQITAALAEAAQENWEAATRTIETLLAERYHC